jgi:hypothetical protein
MLVFEFRSSSVESPKSPNGLRYAHPMTPAEVRDRLTHALRLDLIGPDPGEPQISEILAIPPSRWYLTGFLVPWNAPVSQKQDKEDSIAQRRLSW